MIHNVNKRVWLVIAGACLSICAVALADDFQYHPKERELVKKFIELLPDEYESKSTYFRKCEPNNYDCYLKEIVVFAVGYCKMLDEGMSREDVFRSMDNFFVKEEAIAMVDSGIYIICPHNMSKLKL